MIKYVATSLFDSPAQTLVNTVNTVGVMGKGIAAEYKRRYPKMFKAYQSLCASGELDIGKLHLWRESDHWILNFPTKTTWKKPSHINFIHEGLKTFAACYREMQISSIAFPPLGCGNGNLNWSDVKPVMESYLKNLEIPVYIHDKQVPKSFVPEHNDATFKRPSSYREFLTDIQTYMGMQSGEFRTLSSDKKFHAGWFDDGGIVIQRNGGNSFIADEHIESAWTALQHGFLTAEQYPSDTSRRAKSYLFAILAKLPYVGVTEVKSPIWTKAVAHALYFKTDDGSLDQIFKTDEETEQLCLSLPSAPADILKSKHTD